MRKTKISADISKEASDMLNNFCKKHERSKGFLLEKMIRKFCSGEESAPATQVAAVEKPKRKAFIAPSIADVREYLYSRNVSDSINEAEKFCDFYESKGWVVGKNKMKCWKAAARNWSKGQSKAQLQGKTSGNLSACEAFING